MPLPHRQLEIFYRQLGQQLAVGLTLAQALRAPSVAPAADTSRLAARAEAGESVEQLLRAAGDWLPAGDRPLLRAGAAAGALPQLLFLLADRHAELAATGRRIVLAALYPVGVFHLAACVLPFVRMIDFERGLAGGVAEYLGGLAWILVPAWGGAALLWLGWRRENRGLGWVLDRLPAVGAYRRERALADFSFALGLLLGAGAPIAAAWGAAAGAARSARLQRAAGGVVARIEARGAPGEVLAGTGAFPADYVARYRTGELTGSLDAVLLALAGEHEERARGRLAAAALLYPGLLFAAVVVMVGYVALGFVLNYVRTLNGLIEGL